MCRLYILIATITYTAATSALVLGQTQTRTSVAGTENACTKNVGDILYLDDELELKFCWCPRGNFLMGSPTSEEDRETHETLTKVFLAGFWLGQTEVTQEQWEAVMFTRPWEGRDGVKIGERYPANYITYHDANSFCMSLTKRERDSGRLSEDFEFRIPTEAQWEYACRCGSTTTYGFGNEPGLLNDYGWQQRTWSSRMDHPQEVGKLKANRWGLFDMHGNVHEWCLDSFSDVLPGGLDPVVFDKDSLHIFRGGGWFSDSGQCRCAFRGYDSPSFSSSELGFRIAYLPVRTIGARSR